MTEDTLECPKCGTRIPLTKALTAPIEARLRTKLEGEVKRKELELEGRERSLAEREDKLAKKVEAELKARVPELTRKLRKEIGTEYDRQLHELRDSLDLTTARAERAEKEERELRKGKQQLAEREKALDLEVDRKVEEASRTVEQRVREEVQEADRLKDQERQLQVDGLNKQIVELQQKLAQGSQQTQGEALELELEGELRRAFPGDLIEPVPVGTRGADIVHTVTTPSGQTCGTIIWETKRTKDWSDGWITKLKEDQGRLRGDAAILVSRALPEGVRNFSFNRGVVVSNFACALPVATLVRLRLLEVARQKRVDETSTETREELYRYLTSRDFVSRVESIVLPLAEMKSDLDSEIRAIETRWKKRRREIEKAERSIVGIYGDLQGIVGRARLPEVARLSLPPPNEPESGDSEEPSEDRPEG
jgi:hypothetical protein